MDTTESTATPPETAKAPIDWDERIAKAKARVSSLKKARKTREDALDMRRKIIAGAGLLKALKDDKDLRVMVLPAIQFFLSPQDFEFAFGVGEFFEKN